jgi:hypothetical protein
MSRCGFCNRRSDWWRPRRRHVLHDVANCQRLSGREFGRHGELESNPSQSELIGLVETWGKNLRLFWGGHD